MQLLRPEVLAAHAKVYVTPVQTRRGSIQTEQQLTDSLRTKQRVTDESTPALVVGELLDKLADWNKAIINDEEY